MITSRYLLARRAQLASEMARYGIHATKPPVRYVATYARTEAPKPSEPRKAS